MMVVSAALVSMVLLSGAAAAQGTSQTVKFAKVDIQKLASGYRASKVIGSDVLNDANQSIGKVDDLLVSPNGTAPFAVLSIGGFLGMDTHLVVVPYDSLTLVGNKIVLPGGSRPLAWCNNGAAVVINRHWAGSIKLSRRQAA
jgi:sporulation protein YlmC with PRC-barrel domain